MGIRLVLVALLISGVLGRRRLGGALKDKKKKEAEAAKIAAAAAAKKKTCKEQNVAYNLCEDKNQEEFDVLKQHDELDDNTEATANSHCCKPWLTCKQWYGTDNCKTPEKRKKSSAENEQFKNGKHKKECCEDTPRHVFVKGGNWKVHLKAGANEANAWAAISAHDEKWYKEPNKYWFRKCSDLWTTYIKDTDGPKARCAIGIEEDGVTINHFGPFGNEVTNIQMNAIFDGTPVTIDEYWQPPKDKSFTKVGNAMDPNKDHGIILAILTVGLSAALYMTYKCTRKTDGHYAKLLDEEV